MKYLQPSFTLPASNNAAQEKWDFSVMTEDEFRKKYNVSYDDYRRLSDGHSVSTIKIHRVK